MQPRVSGGQALLAALNGLGELGDVNVIEMGAGGDWSLFSIPA
jgi:hypothetical protein